MDNKTENLIEALQVAPEGVALWDADNRLVMCSDKYRQLHQHISEILVPGLKLEKYLLRLKDGGLGGGKGTNSLDWVENILESRKLKVIPDVVVQYGGKWLQVRRKKLADGSIIAFHSDITEIKKSEERFRTVFESNPALVSISTVDKAILLDVNDVWLKTLGYKKSEVIGKTAFDLNILVDPEVRTRASQNIDQGRHETIQVQFKTKSGEIRDILVSGEHIEFERQDCYLFVSQDTTEHKRIEDQLRQAQRMEAVGQLTAGVAHDFNNILAEISMGLGLVGDDVAENSTGFKLLVNAQQSISKGAKLTNQLLAFSRKQILNPQPTDVNSLVTGMMDLLQRTLGETIAIEFHTQPNLWLTMIDPGQLEVAFLNLAINARDAMPGGGKLTIDSRNKQVNQNDGSVPDCIKPGDYAVLAIADTGTGISNENLKKILEPFYTTKDVGEGSGLGLSMVYGFIRQSGGYILIESEEDKGTEIKLYLPRSVEASTLETQKLATKKIHKGNGETVLVVEDNATLRKLAIRSLERLNYRVIDGGDGSKALELITQNNGEIDLLLSDVVLPNGLSGTEIARTFESQSKGGTVLLMSGYPDVKSQDGFHSGTQYSMINKPFAIEELALAMHDALQAGIK